jgi:hypothetical protein
MTWEVWAASDGNQHVVPKGDMRPHRHSIDCWCRPKLDDEDATITVYNSMDEREKAERAVKQ